ncbi:MAG: putative urea ABC transporter substrate-binding protein [Parvibaculaceae bacterium]
MKLLPKFALAAMTALALVMSAPANAAPKKEFKVAWSIYVGWMPWGYAQDHGIVKKWADKYGLKIDVVQFNDYIESINQYTAGSLDGVTATNMDALAIPSVGGIDTTALIVGDYSNGNDAVILKDKKKLTDIKGQKVNLVELSVSHYLMARALESVGMSEKDVTVVNTSDADMEAAWKTKDVTAVVTWNPMVASILADAHAHSVFNSSAIPGEIQDLLVVNTQTLKDNPDFGKAMTGIWFDTLALMTSKTPEGKAAREAMAKASGTDLAGFEAQLKTTALFSTPAHAVAFTDADLKPAMDKVRGFLFTHGLLGNNAPSADVVGIEFADGKVLGDKANVKFRFTDTYMKLAADGKL